MSMRARETKSKILVKRARETVSLKTVDGTEFYVDRKHELLVRKFKWRAISTGSKHGKIYIRANAGRETRIYLHRLIAALDLLQAIDHANGNPIDNRTQNLRICTHSQNASNTIRPRKVNPYRGSYRRGKKWVAAISQNYEKKRVYGLATAEDAARAYDRMARELYGEFAVLNFPGELQQ